MQSDTGTGVWDSRFDDTADASSAGATPSPSTANSETENNLQDILMIVRNEIPYVQPEFLKFDSHLGQGSSFEVNKELFGLTGEQPYFVAVKRLVMSNEANSTKQSDTERRASSRHLISVKREVRVLTHPKLRSHSCLISAIAWGWEPDPWVGKRLYLVMPYSQHGTLANFAQKRSLNLIDRRFLALDVAMGIRALHDCDIVHGDVKPENVLVYGYFIRDQDHDRHYLAKVADFGCALFKEDSEHHHQYYLGTPKYNAPEICGWVKDRDEKSHDTIPEFTRYKAADCYSFGLLLWETVKHAKSFVETDWLESGEGVMGFLQRSFHSKENAILELATNFFRSREANLAAIEEQESKSRIGVYPSNPTGVELGGYFGSWPQLRQDLDAIGAPPDAQSFQVFEETASLCLQDSIWQRGNIHQIVEALSKGIDGDVPLGGSTTERILPVETKINGESPYAGSRYESMLAPNYDTSPFAKAVYLDKGAPSCSSKDLRALPRDTPADPSRQIARIPPNRRCETLTVTPQAYRYKAEDMFKAVLRRQPPWYNQCEAAKLIEEAISTEQDPEPKAQAHLQMAIMCQVGYGVAPDSLEALNHLEAAAKNNEVARAIFNPVHAALNPGKQEKDYTESHITYKNPAIFLDSLAWRGDSIGVDDQFVTLGPISVDSFRKFEILVKKGRYTSSELCEALTAACRDGHLDAAVILARHCTDFSSINSKIPNPLHWLIMFSQEEASKLLRILISSSENRVKENRLEAVRSLLASEHEQLTVLLPHRCMELRGTPLHWAVTAGYTDLVADFLRLGADVNGRDQWRKTAHEDGHIEHTPSLSPLDLAVAGHHPRIVELLLDHGSEIHGGDWHWSHSPFHMIGYSMFPFGRYVAHGQNYRAALRETIQILVKRGLDINALDNLNQTPLFVAVKNMDLEAYVLEELLLAGAVPGEECNKKHGNVVAAAIIDSAHRRLSSSKIPLLLPLVSDINACSGGGSGLNALHYCAFFDAVPAAEILLQIPGINIEAESTLGATAVSLATHRGSLGVLAQLIGAGAEVHRRETLEGAVSHGQIDALKMLLDAGSGTSWKNSKGGTVSVLRYAVQMRSQRPSYVRACLSKCPQLRAQEIMDQGDDEAWTPLHFCAYYGDVDGTRALIDYGADVDKVASIGLGLTPLGVAVKTFEELTVYVNGVRHFTGHPRIWQDIDRLEKQNQAFPGKARRIETNFADSLFEVIRVLQQAEREKHPGRAVKEVSRDLGKVQTEMITTQKEVRNHYRDLAFLEPRLEAEARLAQLK
ncbi:hypothetical protein NM208_g5557 [Fusarium decemcellulare]|uniref:Uncharacterized protein n=1 Tax=Fusarium decemcellulare TaxID=57161 RepID=A0ACC1SGI7_9HYPO|nr:hypothetical protein NM208_g5557 [Fusarium decemcellulare]